MKKYGLVWEEKIEEVAEMCKEYLPILTEVKSKEIKNNSDSPNILIEGDNYHALSVLNYTHKGKIDVIYIDPPYNTGNEFLYNDKIIDKEDRFRHSKWLSFMTKRLQLAKKLLKNTGVIFISIDDNELSSLRLLCDEIFGEKNFLANIIWQHNLQPKGYSEKFSLHHNYILYYRKSSDFKLRPLERSEKDNINYSNPDNDPNGLWRAGDVRNSLYRKNLIYNIRTPSGKIIKSPSKGWRWSKETIQQKIASGEIIFNSNETKIIRKIYLKNVKGRSIESIWFGEDVGTTRSASQEIKNLFNESVFETPKPTQLIKKIIKISSPKNGIVLDFFAGSGTTAHAVLELNKEDEGTRKFILSTNNENKICTNVCYPRIKKIANGYTNIRRERVKGLGGTIKYFKTDFVEKQPTDKGKQKIAKQSTELLCLKEGCFEKQKETKYFTIFSNKIKKYLAIIYDFDGLEAFIKFMKKFQKKIIVYQFTLDDEPILDDFAEIKEYVELQTIPSPILSTYRRIHK